MIAQPLRNPPLNTLERALQYSRSMARELAEREPRACRQYRIFAALTPDQREAFAAYVLWRARARRA